MIVHPTHTCFDDAMEYLEAVASKKIKRNLLELKLAHGICQVDLLRYAHAWVETPTHCIDGGLVDGDKIYVVIPKAAFYKDRDVLDVTLYTVFEASNQNEFHGTYGPWLQKYLDLTGSRSEITTRRIGSQAAKSPD